jgi:hypothetical protein
MNPMVSQWPKHIVVLHHFVRERASCQEIVLEYCNTECMVADSLTRAVGQNKFVWCRENMEVVPCETSLSGSVDGQTDLA